MEHLLPLRHSVLSSKMHLLFILLLLRVWNCTAIVRGPEDFCLLEAFQPTCSTGEVILMNTAVYGRMKVGKCVTPNSKKIGCYADVLQTVDNLCSGKTTCVVRALDPALADTNPCNSVVLPSYLTVSYSCITAENVNQRCQNQKPIYVTKQSGYLSSQVNQKGCPVILKAAKGSRFNLTIFNFLRPEDRSACYEIAALKDGSSQKTIHICENSERIKHVHLSAASELEITFTHNHELEQLGNFIISFAAMGCPSPPVPENAHAIREGDTATIVCNNSDTTWTTTCKDNKWTQTDRECPTGWSITKLVKTTKEFPYGIFLTSIIGVGLGVLIGGFLLFLAINAFQRYQRRGQQYGPPPVIPDPDYKIYDTAKMDLPFVPGLGHSTLPRHQMAAADVPPAPPPLSEATMKRLSRHTYERPNFPSM